MAHTTVAFALYPGCTLLDFAGATQIFAYTSGFRVVWLATKPDPTTTTEGVSVMPNATFEDVPVADIVFVPGGGGDGVSTAMNEKGIQDWLKAAGPHAQWAGSVCTGAFVAAAAGLFDGCKVTTYWSMRDALALFPSVEVVPAYPRWQIDRDQRRFSGGGISSSLDLALELVKEIAGEAAAQATQVLSATAYREMFKLITLPDWLPLPGKAAKRQALHTLRSLIQGHIDARRNANANGGDSDNPDLLGRLLALRDEETGEGLSPQEVFDQCMVSFQAGHETSATALLWWSRLMAEHPEAVKRAREEVASVVGAGTPGPEHLPQLPWLTATLKETMRLYPPVAAIMSRGTSAPITLGGWNVPKGAMLRMSPYVLHRDARNFANPEAFQPERFLEGAAPMPRGAFMPFGAGPRVCLGQHFAMLEMTLLSAMLLQRFELSLPENAPPPEPELSVTLRPKQPIQLWLSATGHHHGQPTARQANKRDACC